MYLGEVERIKGASRRDRLYHELSRVSQTPIEKVRAKVAPAAVADATRSARKAAKKAIADKRATRPKKPKSAAKRAGEKRRKVRRYERRKRIALASITRTATAASKAVAATKQLQVTFPASEWVDVPKPPRLQRREIYEKWARAYKSVNRPTGLAGTDPAMTKAWGVFKDTVVKVPGNDVYREIDRMMAQADTARERRVVDMPKRR